MEGREKREGKGERRNREEKDRERGKREGVCNESWKT